MKPKDEMRVLLQKTGTHAGRFILVLRTDQDIPGTSRSIPAPGLRLKSSLHQTPSDNLRANRECLMRVLLFFTAISTARSEPSMTTSLFPLVTAV